MSILIKGMEMPMRCGRCDFCIPVFDDGMFDHYECCITAAIIDNLGEKMEDCSLVPVQQHGDLIDRREAIIDANERAYDFWLSDDEVNATIQFLKEQPTIIEAEEGE